MMPGLMAQSQTTWAEDKALQRCNLSAAPGAKTEGGIESACSIPSIWPPPSGLARKRKTFAAGRREIRDRMSSSLH